MFSNRYTLLLKCAAVLTVAFSFSGSASAEGRCPPGQYPIGGQGMAGCAPIPGAGGGESSGPTPTGRWIKTWGAISMASNGGYGTVTGKLKKRDAEKEALAKCASSGGSNCRVSFTYKNQCVAAVIAQSGFGDTRFATAAEEKLAGEEAIKDCQGLGGQGCEVVYSACSIPHFEKY